MLLSTAILLICVLHWCAYNLIARSISQDTISLSLLRNLELHILWVIPVVSYAALLYRQLILHSDASSKLSPNQTLEANNRTQPLLPNLESLIIEQTTKLEYAINQLQSELSKRLQIKESVLCLSKAVEEVGDAICVADANGLPTYINKTFLQSFGYSINELNAVGGVFSLFTTPAVGQEIHSIILNGYSWNGEVEIRAYNGELIQAALRAEAIDNQTSQVIGIIAIFTNITEHKHAESACQKSEKCLSLALSAAHMAAWDWNIKTKEIIWSNNLEIVFGVTPETFNGNFESLMEYIHPDDRQKLTQAVDYAVDEHVGYIVEFRSLWLDGSIRWMESKGQLLYDETDQSVHMLGTLLDITERKKAEESLRESEATNRALLKAIPDILFRISREGFYLDSFQIGALELPSASELIGKHISEFIPAQIAQMGMDAIKQALNTNKIQTIQFQLLTNGEWHQYEARIVAIGTDEVLAFIRDISDYKRAEEELQPTFRRFAVSPEVLLANKSEWPNHAIVFNQTFEFIGLLSPEGILLEANQTALEFAGLQQDEVIGRPFWETQWWTISPATQSGLKAAIAQAAAGKFVRYEVENIGAGGKVITVDFSIKPVCDATGQVVLLIPEGRDITKLKQIESIVNLTST